VEAKFTDDSRPEHLSWWPATITGVDVVKRKYRVVWDDEDDSETKVKFSNVRRRSPEEAVDIEVFKNGQNVLGFNNGFWFDATVKRVNVDKPSVIVSWRELEDESDGELDLDEIRVLNNSPRKVKTAVWAQNNDGENGLHKSSQHESKKESVEPAPKKDKGKEKDKTNFYLNTYMLSYIIVEYSANIFMLCINVMHLNTVAQYCATVKLCTFHDFYCGQSQP